LFFLLEVLAAIFGANAAAVTLTKEGISLSPTNNTMECTPFVWQGQLYLFESYRPTTTSTCTEHLAIKNVATGVDVASFGEGYSFGSAIVKDNQINVYATKYDLNSGDWTHDIYRFTSTDMVNWTSPVHAIDRNDSTEHLFNCSVTKGPQGYVMTYESNQPKEFSTKLARSTDGLYSWTALGASGLADIGCPTIRYNEADANYYVIYGGWGTGAYAGKIVTSIMRSKDLATWEQSDKGPVLAPAAGEGINNSDADLCEYNGKTYVYYATGDQQTWLELRRAVYDGPMSDFLMSYFDPVHTPEPSSWILLLSMGFVGAIGYAWRKTAKPLK
jgi:hypothetical protein